MVAWYRRQSLASLTITNLCYAPSFSCTFVLKYKQFWLDKTILPLPMCYLRNMHGIVFLESIFQFQLLHMPQHSKTHSGMDHDRCRPNLESSPITQVDCRLFKNIVLYVRIYNGSPIIYCYLKNYQSR